MSNLHHDRYITKLLLGFTFVICSIFVIFYACFERTRQDDWYFWGMVACALMCIGLYFLFSSFVHKMKSDLIKRSKKKEQIKTYTPEVIE